MKDYLSSGRLIIVFLIAAILGIATAYIPRDSSTLRIGLNFIILIVFALSVLFILRRGQPSLAKPTLIRIGASLVAGLLLLIVLSTAAGEKWLNVFLPADRPGQSSHLQ